MKTATGKERPEGRGKRSFSMADMDYPIFSKPQASGKRNEDIDDLRFTIENFGRQILNCQSSIPKPVDIIPGDA